MKTRYVAAWLALALIVPLYASQNNVYLPTTGTYTGLQAANTINNALDALLTCNKGSVAPTNALGGAPKAGQCWLDDSSATLLVKKRYSGSGWVVESVIDVSNGINVPPVGGGRGTVASASTTDLCASPQSVQSVSGTTTITSFGSACINGERKVLVFDGALTLTYNATSLILPGAFDIVTAAGDVAEAVYLGSGNWRVINFTRISGAAVVNPALPLATVLYGDYGVAPAKTVHGRGQALARASYPEYTAAVTITVTATRTNGNATLTSVSSTEGLGAGMGVEGTGIGSACTIASVTSTTIVMNSSGCATSSGTGSVNIIVPGYGSGGSNSTVGVKDCRGKMMAGLDTVDGLSAGLITTAGGAVDGNSMKASGGAQSRTIGQTHLPNYNLTHNLSISSSVTINDPGHTHVSPGDFSGVQSGAGATARIASGGTATGSSTTGITASLSSAVNGGVIQLFGGGNAMPTLPPVAIARCVVVVLP